jgi:hypothetical protein
MNRNPSNRRSWKLLLLLLGWLVAAGGSASAADMSVGEYQLKAAWLYHLTRFVEWPETNFASSEAAFVIGVAGDDPFGASLDEVARSETVHGHPIVIKRLKPGDSPAACHILYISRSEQGHLDTLLAQVEGKSILTVADLEGACAQGVMVNLIVSRDTVKLEINNDRAKETKLQVSSRLLGLAKIVKTSKQP